MPPALLPAASSLQPPMSPAGPLPAAGLFASPLSSPASALAGLPVHVAPPPLRPANFSPVTNLRDNPPCNTLFM
jgi:hypothetical protein